MTVPASSKVVIAGVARDCAAYLPAVLRNVERLSSLFDEAAYVFVENDSVDATRQMLIDWGAERPNFWLINLGGLGQVPIRTLRLEFARSAYLEFLKAEPQLADFRHLCVLDMDDMGSQTIALDGVATALSYMRQTMNCAGVFANQLGAYYDLWALRHPDICPGDVWFEVLERAHCFGLTDRDAFEQTLAKRIRSFDPAMAPVEVESAFGGLAIYDLDFVRCGDNQYLGSRVRQLRSPDGRPVTFRIQQCEHVHFHAGLRQLGGRLFIVPSMINAVTSSTLNLPPSWFRTLCF